MAPRKLAFYLEKSLLQGAHAFRCVLQASSQYLQFILEDDNVWRLVLVLVDDGLLAPGSLAPR